MENPVIDPKKTIIGLPSSVLAVLEPIDIGDREMSREEVIYFIKNLPDCFAHEHSMEKLHAGKPGIHPILRKGQHSDRFINVKEAMQKFPNFRRIMADQLARKIVRYLGFVPRYIAGMPSAAVDLGVDIAWCLDTGYIKLKKISETQYAFDDDFEPPEAGECLRIDDVFTTGDSLDTGKAFLVSRDFQVLPAYVVVANRSNRKDVISLTDYVGKEWWPANGEVCERCAAGSRAMKPKVSEETWQEYIHSQD
jgi:orotate phosphoribosyltransferase